VYRGTVVEEGERDGASSEGPAAVAEPEGDLERRLAAQTALFQQLLKRHQAREIAYGVSLCGPHRDDLAFLVDERELAVYGSRGQQRTAALSLKLAEAALMRQSTAEEPIVLLDDVMSELDRRRGHRVLEAMGALQQVLITAIDLHSFDPGFLAGAAILGVEQGAVSGAGEQRQRAGEA
jgi:DNA replication and repair protein RecF